MDREKTWQHYRAKVAALSRSRPADDPELLQAEADLKAVRDNMSRTERTAEIINYLTGQLSADPPLAPEQIQEIVAVLTGQTHEPPTS